MKTTKIIYWVTTGIVTLMMVYSGFAYLTQPAMRQAFQHLGYPDYFRVELAIAKLTGVILLLVPVQAKIKELVYAGFALTFISACIAHSAAGDPISNRITPIIFLALLVISYLTYNKRQDSRQKAAN